LGSLGVDLPDLADRPVLNTRGERVGEVVTAGVGPALTAIQRASARVRPEG